MVHQARKAVASLKRKHAHIIYGVILRDRRKELKMIQKELADKTGMVRSYIARVERGETDMQLSSFLRIANALRINFTPVFA